MVMIIQKSDSQLDSRQRYQYIDFMRGLAIFGVIGVHSMNAISDVSIITKSIFNSGQLGVQLFFLISAFTLCLSVRGKENEGIGGFYVRRFFRIAPLYYIGIALYFLWRIAKEYYKTNELKIPLGYNLTGVLENLLFLHGFDPNNYNFVVPGGWSIATEVAFYMVFPYLYLIQCKLKFEEFLTLSIQIIAVSFLIQLLFIQIAQPHFMKMGLMHEVFLNDEFGFIYCSLLNQISVFLIGMLTYRSLEFAQINKFTLVVAFVLFAISGYLLNTTLVKTGYNGFVYPILAAVAFGVFTVKLSKMRDITYRPFKLLANIGKASYSMYLLHFLILDVLFFVFTNSLFKSIQLPELRLSILFFATTAVTYAAAKLSFSKLEAPCINYAKKYIK